MPLPVASHSASSAPTIAAGAEIRAAVKNDGRAEGIITLRMVVQVEPP